MLVDYLFLIIDLFRELMCQEGMSMLRAAAEAERSGREMAIR
jgi:hypothetical protein